MSRSYEHIVGQLVFHLARGPIGRRTLVRRTGLTEAVVRAQLEQLREQGLIEAGKLGTSLLRRARVRFSDLLATVLEIKGLRLHDLALDVHNRAAHLRGVQGTPPLWQLRDYAVQEGGSGALFLRERSGSWCLVDDDFDLASRSAREARVIDLAFPQSREGDLIAIAFGPTVRRAMLGLWRVIAALVPHPRERR